MINLPLKPHKWFEELPDSIDSLYNRSFNKAVSSIVEKNLNELLVTNFTLWGFEDEARRKDVPDQEIANLKRNIDRENQKRHNLIDKIDELLREDIKDKSKGSNDTLPLNTETPASILDRLIILALRKYHLKKETERKDTDVSHTKRCILMLKETEERSADLLISLEELLIAYYSGKKRLKSYKEHKLYNDPSLNPALRKQSS
ncbi:DUF4254 domain-containing protein [Candidatus Omnitrophota bacterium]